MPPDFPLHSVRAPGAFRVVEGGAAETSTSTRPPLLPAPSPLSVPRIAARRKKSLVFIAPHDVWAFEADARLVFVHSLHGRLDIDVSLTEIEASALGHMFARVHRSWLVNLALVKALDHAPGETLLFVNTVRSERGGIRVPVSRDRVRKVREALLASTIGVRRREGGTEGALA
jgi:DNA-binding LytR/AlgR family response regulator